MDKSGNIGNCGRSSNMMMLIAEVVMIGVMKGDGQKNNGDGARSYCDRLVITGSEAEE